MAQLDDREPSTTPVASRARRAVVVRAGLAEAVDAFDYADGGAPVFVLRGADANDADRRGSLRSHRARMARGERAGRLAAMPGAARARTARLVAAGHDSLARRASHVRARADYDARGCR